MIARRNAGWLVLLSAIAALTRAQSPPAAAPELHSDALDQKTAFERESQALIDRGLNIQSIEMPAYLRLLEWASSASQPALRARAIETPFADLMQKPGEHRGELQHVDLIVRQIQSYDIPDAKGDGPRKVYELVGWPTASRGWLYVVITPELPPGVPEKGDVELSLRVDGYFLKLQGYQSMKAKPGAAPLAAPLLVGRVERTPRPETRSSSSGWMLAVVVGGGLLMAANFLARRFWGSRRAGAGRRGRNRSTNPDSESDETPDDASFEWLDDQAADPSP